MSVAVHREIEGIASDWDRLVDRTGQPPFFRPGWFAAWWDAFGAGQLEILTLHRGEALAAVLPLYRRRGALRGASNWHTPEFGVAAVDEESAATLMAAAVGRAPRALSLAFVDPRSPGYDELIGSAGARRRVLVRTLEEQPTLSLERGIEALEDTLGAKAVRETRRRWRKLAELGEVDVEIVDGSERLEQLLAEGFAIEDSGWKGKTAIAASAPTLAFYTELARWAAARGWLRLTFLRLDGRAIAFRFAFEHRHSWYLVKGGYDTEFHRYGPGRLLADALIRHACSRGLTRFEFLGSASSWKLEWTDETNPRHLVQMFSRSVPGLLEWSAYAYGRPLAKRIRVLERAVLALRR